MGAPKDFYAILGVSRDANDKALRSAYKKLAMKHHPDKNDGNDTMFKKVAEAYSVLSDKDKRVVYDKLGEEGLKAGVSAEEAKRYGGSGGGASGFHFGGGPQGFNGGGGGGGGAGFQMPPGFADDLFAQFFSQQQQQQHQPGGHFPQVHRQQRRQQEKLPKKPPVVRNVYVSLKSLLEGSTKKLKISRKALDERTGQYSVVCKTVELQIKPGMKEGCKFTFKSLGNDEPHHEPSDMVFVLKILTDSNFKREGDDLVTTVPIELKDALEGGVAKVENLEGRTIRVPFGPLASSRTETVLPDAGLPNPKTGKRGSLCVQFDVRFPESKKRKVVAECL